MLANFTSRAILRFRNPPGDIAQWKNSPASLPAASSDRSLRKRRSTPPFGEQIEAFKKHLIPSRMGACDNNHKRAAKDCR